MKVRLYFVADKSYDSRKKSNSYLAITNSEADAQELCATLEGATHYVSRDVFLRGGKR